MCESGRPVEQEADVVACGCEDGVDAVAFAMGEVVSAHAVLVLDVTDDRFDGGTALHLLFDCGRHTAFLALGKDAEGVGVGSVVASVSGIGEDLFDLIANEVFYAGDYVFQGVAIIRVSGKGHGMDGELAAFGTVERGGE